MGDEVDVLIILIHGYLFYISGISAMYEKIWHMKTWESLEGESLLLTCWGLLSQPVVMLVKLVV
jgi:hypothetical protein